MENVTEKWLENVQNQGIISLENAQQYRLEAGMLKRKIEKDIQEWIRNDNRALMIYGVRQAGKTFIIRKCLEDNNCDYVEFNLIEQPEIVTILENSTGTDDLLTKLSLYSSRTIKPGETFIFLDEIQKYKDILTRIKFLVDDGRCRYIMSGSLLGVEITNLRSAPVGYLKTLKMFPLDFEEFLQVFNVPQEVIDTVYNAYRNTLPVDESIHRKLMELFNLYIIIGGMPAAVEKYRVSGNIDIVIEEHRDIIEQYKLDFTQYEESSRKLVLSAIYELMPAELNEQGKRFKVADIDKNLRYERVSDSFTWLWKSGVAIPVFNVTQPVIPLMINEKSNLFKLFMSDVGMLTSIYGKAAKLKVLQGDRDINKGAVYENVIAQELLAHGYDLYYYSNKKKGELDFVIEEGESPLPVEVKSGKNYTRHSAINNVLNETNYSIDKAVVFSESNVRTDGRIVYMPLYMIMAMHRDDVEFADISAEKYMW